MSIESKHPEYDNHKEDWNDIRTFYAGPRKVREAGEKYLPATEGMRLDGLGAKDPGLAAYNAYKRRARVPDYIKEAVEALVGLLHQKNAIIELPPQLEYLRTKASASGENLDSLYRRVSVEQITTGRLGLLADLPATVSQTSHTPYIALYTAESITNWDNSSETDDVIGPLNFVVLDESGRERVDIFNWKDVKRYRVLELSKVEGEEKAVYKVGIFSDANGLTYSPESMSTPMLRGDKLDFIPFVFINTKDLLPDPDEAPLKGLLELCIGIYQAEADYRQSLYMQGQDTLVVIGGVRNPTGVAGEPEAIRTGAGSRIDVDTGGDAKYIGVSADGLAEQRTAIESDRKRAEIKSGELIQNNGSQMESGQALNTRFNAQTATLNQLAWTAANGLENALRGIARWMGADENKVKVTPNTEFINFALDGANFKSLVEAKNLGFPISEESLHALAADRGITVMDFVSEMEKVEVDRVKQAERDRAKMELAAEFTPKPAPGSTGPKPPAKPTPKPAKSGGKK